MPGYLSIIQSESIWVSNYDVHLTVLKKWAEIDSEVGDTQAYDRTENGQ